jgi:hypothetical protein
VSALRHGDTVLVVPYIHPETPRAARVKIYEAVLRRQFGLADCLAEIETELIEHSVSRRHRLGLPDELLAA